MLDDDLEKNFGARLWHVQPKWVKFLAVTLMLPAWIIFAFSIFNGQLNGILLWSSVTLFAIVGAIELIFITRAIINGDL